MRFIPAHAGNTLPTVINIEGIEVHPRSRGEYVYVTVNGETHTGSSPLTRGIPTAMAAQTQQLRFIPAHAGNTHADRLWNPAG